MNELSLSIFALSFCSYCIGHFMGRTGNDKHWIENINHDTCLHKFGNKYKVIAESEWVKLSTYSVRFKEEK